MKRIIAVAACIALALSLAGCGRRQKESMFPKGQDGVPDDFSFSLVWDVRGISSYDSLTGELVKMSIASDPDEYTTTCFLSDEDLETVYRMIVELDPESYPDEYDPIRNSKSKPSRDIVLTVRCSGKTKTIECRNISMGHDAKAFRGAGLLNFHDSVVGMLRSTEEWQALPDYEFHFE